MTSQKIALVFVPGWWMGPGAWQPVSTILSDRYETHIAPWVSTGHSYNPAAPAGLTLADDIAAVRKVVKQLVEEGKLLMLIGTSAGGIIASACCEGLTRNERAAAGLAGGVVRLAFVAGAIMYRTDEYPWCDWQDAEKRGHLCKDPRNSLYNDIEDNAKADKEIATLRVQPGVGWGGGGELPWLGWREGSLPAVYIITTRDQLLPVSLQETFAAKAGASVRRIDAGHMAIVSKPEEVASLLDREVAMVSLS